MSVSIGTGVGPVRVAKRLGGKKAQVSSQDMGSGVGYMILALGGLVVGSVLLTALVFWAAIAAALALDFAALAGIGFGISKFVPGAHDWGMKFSRVARWCWFSIPAFARTMKSRKIWGKR